MYHALGLLPVLCSLSLYFYVRRKRIQRRRCGCGLISGQRGGARWSSWSTVEASAAWDERLEHGPERRVYGQRRPQDGPLRRRASPSTTIEWRRRRSTDGRRLHDTTSLPDTRQSLLHVSFQRDTRLWTLTSRRSRHWLAALFLELACAAPIVIFMHLCIYINNMDFVI